jgi:hypothetical protein
VTRRALVFLLLFPACREPTEVTVVVTTTVPCADVRGTSLFVGTRLGASTTACAGNAIGSMVLVPSGSNSASALLSVTLGVNKDPSACAETPAGSASCIFARRRIGFIPHQPLTIGVELQSACIGVVCSPDATCNAGACVPLETPTLDAGPPDAGPSDAAPADAGADAADAGDAGDAGGPCPAAPTVLYEISSPTQMAVNATHVALLMPTSLVLVPRGAGAVDVRNVASPAGLALDPARAYYSDAVGLHGVDLTDLTSDTVLVSAPNAERVGAIAADAKGVFFVQDLTTGAALRTLGGVAASIVSAPSPGEQLALGTNVVFMTRGNVVFAVSRAAQGADLTTLVLGSESTAPLRIRAQGDRAFWIESAGATSRIFTKTPFGITSLGFTIDRLVDFTSSPAALYWTASSPAPALYRLANTASVPDTLDTVTSIGPVASDGVCLFYWAASPRGAGIFWSRP